MLPGMEDRQGDLRQQRELIAAHLRWLDQEIARTAQPTEPVAAVPPVSPPPAPGLPGLQAPLSSPLSTAAQIAPELTLPEIDPHSIRNDVRRGCFIYILVVSLLLAASVAVAVWIAGE